MKLTPLETIYNGYRFRSRLEARWAIFFDALGIDYEYEKEGYDLQGTWYLPDFWLPERNHWLEVKGQAPTAEEWIKMTLLCCLTEKFATLSVGNIGPDAQHYVFLDGGPYTPRELVGRVPPPYHLFPQQWGECEECQCVQLFVYCTTGEGFGWCRACGCQNMRAALGSPRLLSAYAAARQARFEHEASGLRRVPTLAM